MNFISPLGCTACSFASTFPVSVVSVTRTESSASVMSPTLLSGLDLSLDWVTRLTASCWAWRRVGRKSPLRMYSELSTLLEK